MSSYVDATSGVVEHCQAMAAQFPDLEEQYSKIASYCQNKLWHQLTLAVLDFVSQPSAFKPTPADKNTYWALCQNVVLVVDKKINQLSLSRIASSVAFASLEAKTCTVEESTKLLQDLLTKQESNNNTATVLYLQSRLGLLTLQTSASPAKEQLDSIYSTIKTNGPLLNQLVPDTPEAMIVNAAHYELSVTYYKFVGPPEAFYDEAMQYLNYYKAQDDAKSYGLAVDLCLAALTGEGVYNLGQVVNNPILHVLANKPEAWLVDLLQACASGNVQLFKQLCTTTYAAQIASQPALVNMAAQMQEKITLLGLVELVFRKPASERTLEFSEIAQGLEIPLEQVEWAIMRAFSVELIKGSMDQVEGTVHVTWILPRALSPEQMSGLATRFGEWANKVQKIQEYMQQDTPALTQ
ncbi:PCI domain containing protein [Nitzschia inconspicua]|uniref:PCI domain containing protein n=1 Tax=Nitzschia inconspicua TaxID=303405 RepID=A0A9K3Q082_9STRA|nr:PCI domain containing protein [Nitzschia inconspicua]